MSNLNFWVSEVKKVKFGSVEKMGCESGHVSISQKVQIFGEKSILMKCSILYGGLRGSIQFLIFEIFHMVFSDLRHGQVPVKHEHYRQPLSKVCLQQFLYENGTQLCSYLLCRFVFDQGLGARKEFDQNAVL